MFFRAIALPFTPQTVIPELSADQKLMQSIWPSCGGISTMFSDFLGTIFENAGRFVLCCLIHLVRRKKSLTISSFLLLSSLVPLIDLIRTNGRPDHTGYILRELRKIGAGLTHSVYAVDTGVVTNLSQFTADTLPFCIEQLMSEFFDFLPKCESDTAERVLLALIPWFSRVNCNIENRVISDDSELLFMRFTCYSYAETLIERLSSAGVTKMGPTNYAVWRALVLRPNRYSMNAQVVLHAIKPFGESAMQILRCLFDLTPSELLDHYIYYLTFNFQYARLFNQRLQQNDMRDIDNSDVSLMSGMSYNIDGYSSLQSSHNSETIDFYDSARSDIYTTQSSTQRGKDYIEATLILIERFARDSIFEVKKFLPTIAAFSVTFHDIYPNLTEKLITTIMSEMMPYLAQKPAALASELARRFPTLPIPDPKFLMDDYKRLPADTASGWTEVSRLFANFISLTHPEGAEIYATHLLRWGLCNGDIPRATVALRCCAGVLELRNSTVIGLCARSLASASLAAEYIVNAGGSDIIPYAGYLKAMMMFLETLAQAMTTDGTLVSDPAIFWMGMEGLKCNSPLMFPVFNSSLSLLEYYFSKPKLFESLANPELYTGEQFTISTFWKYHSPWNVRYPGCLAALFAFEGSDLDMARVIRVLNMMVQTRYPPLFSESPTWYAPALLSLIPWFWSVILTDVRQYREGTKNINMMKSTIEAFCDAIADSDIIETLQSGFCIDADVGASVEILVHKTAKMIDPEGMGLVCHFFTNCLKSGKSSLKTPLYIVGSYLIDYASNGELNEFAEIVSREQKDSRRVHAKGFLEKFMFSKKVTEKEKVTFPHLEMFDRIVAVLVPHLYSPVIPADQKVDFSDLNTFPTLLPDDDRVREKGDFVEIEKGLREINVEPHTSRCELLSKMKASIIDREAVAHIKAGKMAPQFAAHEIFGRVCKEMKEEIEYQEETENPVEEEDLTDPFSLFVV